MPVSYRCDAVPTVPHDGLLALLLFVRGMQLRVRLLCQALTKFLRSIEWDNAFERKQAVELMDAWSEVCTLLRASRCLMLLHLFFSF